METITNVVRRLTAVGLNMTLSAPAIAAAVVLLWIKIGSWISKNGRTKRAQRGKQACPTTRLEPSLRRLDSLSLSGLVSLLSRPRLRSTESVRPDLLEGSLEERAPIEHNVK